MEANTASDFRLEERSSAEYGLPSADKKWGFPPLFGPEKRPCFVPEECLRKRGLTHTLSERSTAFLGKLMPGAGFEPAKLYAEDLESTPFDRSGTPACVLRSDLLFLTIALHQVHPNLWVEGAVHSGQ